MSSQPSRLHRKLHTLILTDSHLFCLCLQLPDWEGNGTPLQYSCLENPMDGGGWWAAVHGIAKSRTRLSDFPFTFHFHALEKEMATHSSVFAWRIPGMGEPGGLPSMGSHRVGHDWSDLAAAAAAENLLISEKAFFRWVLVLKILWCIYIKYIYMCYISKCYREFPGGLVVRIWHFHCHG